MTKTSTYPLRLPVSLKVALEKLRKQGGTSMNQFVAEKISALNTATFFEERRAKGDRRAVRRILNRKRGESPRSGDEL